MRHQRPLGVPFGPPAEGSAIGHRATGYRLRTAGISLAPRVSTAIRSALMESSHWPLAGLRLQTPHLRLRPTTESDLPAVAATLSDDVRTNPHLPHFPGLATDASRAVSAYQSYWQSVGTWSIDSWRLDLVIETADRIVGVQSLEAEDFLTLRTVDSASHLVSDARGRGWGKQARCAVLAFAFDTLDAEYAVTSAWQDNGASLGVSRALGYQPNGKSRHRSDDDGQAATMVHLRLSRTEWDATGQSTSIQISGFEQCRPLFGL